MDQGLWLRKGVDRDITFNGSSSRIESNKRTHQWFIDGAELDLYTYKKQAVESSNSTMPGSELPSGGPPAWDHHSNNFQSDQFANQLFQSEAAGLENFPERTVSSGDAEACISYYGGLRRVKVNQAASNKEEENDDLLTGETYNGGAEAHAETTNASDSSAVAKSKPRSSRNKLDMKTSRKEAPPNSFPSNVRSLLSTGMLDGVPVMYVASSREVIRGVVKGSGYLCGCLSCNHSKVLNAFEFERHAGCKTKHPNNHIYFENGKTIYQIVQELRSTPESKLFDAIQTVFGAPINQKSFKIWKESFQAATRELQRIYGKEELNL